MAAAPALLWLPLLCPYAALSCAATFTDLVLDPAVLSAWPCGCWGTLGWWAGVRGCSRVLLQVPSRTDSRAMSLPSALLGSQGLTQTLSDKKKESALPSGIAVGSQICP